MEIMVGEYRRRFDAAQQPFEVADAEEARLLRNTGFFIGKDESETTGEEGNGEGAKAQSEDSSTNSVANVVEQGSKPPKPKASSKIGGAPPPPDAAEKPE